MRRKFKILYPQDYHDPDKAGKQFETRSSEDMLVMNSSGVFFIYNGRTYYPSIRKLSDEIDSYDVVWVD
jgi:hypothetical protein